MQVKNKKGKCRIENCKELTVGQKLCNAHYRRLRKWGDPRPDVPLKMSGKKGCKVKSCIRPYEGKGFCRLHRRRFKKHGDALGKVPVVKRDGRSNTITYNSWRAMKDRCTNPNSFKFKDYGGRGIKLCRRWYAFENFLEDMGERKSAKLSIDRINNEKGYNKNNCRWATTIQQANNKRKNLRAVSRG